MKRRLLILSGATLFILGVLGAGITAIVQGDLFGRLIGGIVGIGVACVGLWLMRRVEKSYAKVFEAMLDLLLLTWP